MYILPEVNNKNRKLISKYASFKVLTLQAETRASFIFERGLFELKGAPIKIKGPFIRMKGALNKDERGPRKHEKEPNTDERGSIRMNVGP